MNGLGRVVVTIVALLLATSCWKRHDELTTIKGKVTNSITGDAFAGIPVEVMKCFPGWFTGDFCDSLSTVYTDQNGNYELTFLAKSGFYYNVGVARNDYCENSDTQIGGTMVIEGKLNTVDFRMGPLVTLEVHLKENKGGKNYLYVWIDSNCGRGWWGGPMFIDTARVNQLIDTISYLHVPPRCSYVFSKSLCYRDGVNLPTGCVDYPSPRVFRVEYVDTTRIILE